MNNNRFKFRAWDKENKVLHYNAECAYDSMKGTPPLMHDSFGDLLDDEQFTVEQCTGLTDKNGNLIFEGDVLRDGFETAIVTWDGDHYILEYDNGGVGEFAIWAKTFEISGNIFEKEQTK